MMKFGQRVWVLAMVFGLFVKPTTAGAVVGVNEDLLIAKPCGQGSVCTYTWTLGSRLGNILELAEEMFGPRDKSWTILGVEFTTADNPSVWYPGNRKNVLIQLTQECMKDEKRALYQLSHEAFHVLSPLGPKTSSTVLEEGLAVYFSIQYLRSADIKVDNSYVSSPKYRLAYTAVLELYKKYPDASKRIAQLRQSNESLGKLSAAQLSKAFPEVHPGFIKQLLQPF